MNTCREGFILTTAATALAAFSFYAASAPISPASAQSRQSFGEVPEARMIGGIVAPEEIIEVARHAGFVPRSRPILRGGRYLVFATDRYLMDLRLTIDARSGRILSATRLAGATYDGRVYEGTDAPARGGPRVYSPGLEAEGRAVALPRPSAGTADPQGRTAVAAPLPRSRPELGATDVKSPAPAAQTPTDEPAEITTSAVAHRPPRTSAPDATDNAPPDAERMTMPRMTPLNREAGAPPVSQPPAMAPVTPLE